MAFSWLIFYGNVVKELEDIYDKGLMTSLYFQTNYFY